MHLSSTEATGGGGSTTITTATIIPTTPRQMQTKLMQSTRLFQTGEPCPLEGLTMRCCRLVEGSPKLAA